MSIDRWMDKEVVVYTQNGILVTQKETTFESVNEVGECRTYYTE